MSTFVLYDDDTLPIVAVLLSKSRALKGTFYTPSPFSVVSNCVPCLYLCLSVGHWILTCCCPLCCLHGQCARGHKSSQVQPAPQWARRTPSPVECWTLSLFSSTDPFLPYFVCACPLVFVPTLLSAVHSGFMGPECSNVT